MYPIHRSWSMKKWYKNWMYFLCNNSWVLTLSNTVFLGWSSALYSETCNTRFNANYLKIDIRTQLKALNVLELDTVDHVMINTELKQQKIEKKSTLSIKVSNVNSTHFSKIGF